VEVRDLETRDEGALRDFFEAIPDEDRGFFKEHLEEPAILTRWIDDARGIRMVVDDDGRLAAVAAVWPGIGRSAHVGDLRLVVARGRRREGLGRLLARRALVEASPTPTGIMRKRASSRRTVVSTGVWAEILAMGGVPHLETAVAALAPKIETLVVTRGAAGALAVRGAERADVAAEPVREVVDTTGAGDLFAAGFLFGEATGKDLAQSLKLGAICAAEIIQHYGARPEADLRALAGELAA